MHAVRLECRATAIHVLNASKGDHWLQKMDTNVHACRRAFTYCFNEVYAP